MMDCRYDTSWASTRPSIPQSSLTNGKVVLDKPDVDCDVHALAQRFLGFPPVNMVKTSSAPTMTKLRRSSSYGACSSARMVSSVARFLWL